MVVWASNISVTSVSYPTLSTAHSFNATPPAMTLMSSTIPPTFLPLIFYANVSISIIVCATFRLKVGATDIWCKKYVERIAKEIFTDILTPSVISIQTIASMFLNVASTVICCLYFTNTFASFSVASVFSKVIRSKNKHRRNPTACITAFFNCFESSYIFFFASAFLLFSYQTPTCKNPFG